MAAPLHITVEWCKLTFPSLSYLDLFGIIKTIIPTWPHDIFYNPWKGIDAPTRSTKWGQVIWFWFPLSLKDETASNLAEFFSPLPQWVIIVASFGNHSHFLRLVTCCNVAIQRGQVDQQENARKSLIHIDSDKGWAHSSNGIKLNKTHTEGLSLGCKGETMTCLDGHRQKSERDARREFKVNHVLRLSKWPTKAVMYTCYSWC